MQYHLPESTYEDWARNETRAFTPDERQKQVIEVVRRAIEDEGLYYTRDVYAFCVKQLLPSTEDLAKGAKGTEGGEVGMDLYYARQYLDARKRFALEDQVKAQLQPQPGMKLGTLVLQDLKRYTGAVITAVDGDNLTIEAKCGAIGYRFVTTAVGVRNGLDRAQERKQRKTSFAEFCEALHQPIQPKPTVATTESESASLF